MRIGLLVLICIVVIFSVLRTSQIPEPLRSVDGDVAHVFAYLVLTGFAIVAWPRRGILLASASMLLLSFLVEVFQLAAPSRGFEWSDMSANLVGVCGGALLGWLVRALRMTTGAAVSAHREKPPAPGGPKL